MSKIPVVAIIGRANVGKSSVFNRLIGYKQAIVANQPGTTRDNVTGLLELDKDRVLRLVDTAGLKRAEDEFEASIQEQIEEATQAADLILLTVDGSTMLTQEDKDVAKTALKSKTPTIMLINKADRGRKIDFNEWNKTGVKDLIAVSAIHGIGFDQLEQRLKEKLPKAKRQTTDAITVALIGRPNVGKSYLFNALAKKQQAVVANIAGTTRDVNRTELKYKGKEIRLLDTAGIRRPGKIQKGIEKFSVLRTMAAIDEADICMLLMDVNELNVSMDQKLAGIIADSGKGLILTVSKWDTLEDKDEYSQNNIGEWIGRNYQHVPWAQLMFTSAETGQNVQKIFDQVLDLDLRLKQKLETKDLNKMLRKVVQHHPPAGPAGKKIYPKLKYAVQTGVKPMEVTIHGKNAKLLHWSYMRFVEKAIRENWDLSGVPLKIWLKNDEDRKKEKAESRKE